MTIGEFMAWLEGYKASFIGGGPTVDQFVEIERRLKLTQKPAVAQRQNQQNDFWPGRLVGGQTFPPASRGFDLGANQTQEAQYANLRSSGKNWVGEQPNHDGDAYGGRFTDPGFDHDVSFKGGVDA